MKTIQCDILAFLVLIISCLMFISCGSENNTASPTSSSTNPTPSPQPNPSLLEMVSIIGGSFDMGDDTSDRIDERPVHRVSVSSFIMAKYEVRYDDWEKVREWAVVNGYDFDNLGDAGNEYYGDGDHPVTWISWYDAIKWCNALSEMEKRTPCYYTDANDSVYRTGRIDIRNEWVKWDANGYRLPTEAEWEYACRANTTTKYSFGNVVYASDANFKDSEDPWDNGTTPVGYYHANDYGLYDMHGNVWEWCWDWYGIEYYKESPTIDPKGPSEGFYRVNRGGCWNSLSLIMRSAIRGGTEPIFGSGPAGGFRPVRSDGCGSDCGDGSNEATITTSPTEKSIDTDSQISATAKETAMLTIIDYDYVEGVDICRASNGEVVLTLIVDPAITESDAKQLGDDFVRLVKTLSDDDNPGKEIGTGIYNYTIVIYRCDDDIPYLLGAKISFLDHINW